MFNNRWSMPFYSRPSNWVIVGISKEWFSPKEYEYRLSFFGLYGRVWFKREDKKYNCCWCEDTKIYDHAIRGQIICPYCKNKVSQT